MLRPIWDIILIFGNFYILKVGLALFKLIQKELMADEVSIFGGFNLVRMMTCSVNLKSMVKEVFRTKLTGKVKYSSLETKWERKLTKEIFNIRKKKESPKKSKK